MIIIRARIDLNCDLGESFGIYRLGNDAQVMPNISSANIACGLHAGDPTIMLETVILAKKHKVAIGAHPGFPDLAGFGRREMNLSPSEIQNCVTYQIGALQAFAKAAGVWLQHVKPHGALYNMAVKDQTIAKATISGVKAVDSALILFAPPKSELAMTGTRAGLRVAHEFFADRTYNADGTLVSRTEMGSIIHEPRKMLQRVLQVVTDGTVRDINDQLFEIGAVHTVCLHGDTPDVIILSRMLNKGLSKAGVKIESAGKLV